MARPEFQALPGMRDLVAPATEEMRALVGTFAEQARSAGFGLVQPPMMEDVGVFERLGESSEVVSKELYEFEDRAGRRVALRPEQTASVCRMFSNIRPTTPWKVWYHGPNFRYDKPQKGRYRQFDQVGAEIIGTYDPDVDTELIVLASRFYERIGLDVILMINSLGDFSDRPRYLAALTEYFEANSGELSDQARTTLKANPLRLLDSKRPEDQAVAAGAPLLSDYMSSDSQAAFERVLAGLDSVQVAYEVAPRLVRGLDYYTRTTFEFVANGLDAAQTAVGGGGRYDGLVAALGGPSEPGVGFALGVDRTLLACEADGIVLAPLNSAQAWVVDTTGTVNATVICDELRRGGFRAERAFDQRSMKAQMKAANRSGAPIAVIVGEDELAAGTVSIKELRSEAGQRQIPRSELLPTVAAIMGSPT